MRPRGIPSGAIDSTKLTGIRSDLPDSLSSAYETFFAFPSGEAPCPGAVASPAGTGKPTPGGTPPCPGTKPPKPGVVPLFWNDDELTCVDGDPPMPGGNSPPWPGGVPPCP